MNPVRNRDRLNYLIMQKLKSKLFIKIKSADYDNNRDLFRTR